MVSQKDVVMVASRMCLAPGEAIVRANPGHFVEIFRDSLGMDPAAVQEQVERAIEFYAREAVSKAASKGKVPGAFAQAGYEKYIDSGDYTSDADSLVQMIYVKMLKDVKAVEANMRRNGVANRKPAAKKTTAKAKSKAKPKANVKSRRR